MYWLVVEKMCVNVRLPSLPIDNPMQIEIFVAVLLLNNGALVWKVRIREEEQCRQWANGLGVVMVLDTFKICNHKLLLIATTKLPEKDLHRIVNGTYKATRGPTSQVLYGCTIRDAGDVDDFIWSNGHALLQTSMTHMQRIQALETNIHMSIHKWERDIGHALDLSKLWKFVWRPYRAIVELHFLWQTAYRVPTTNYYRAFGLSASHSDTWWTRCLYQATKDVACCIWSYPKSQGIWKWAMDILQRSLAHHEQLIVLSLDEALLGYPMRTSREIVPKMLWELLRRICCWQVWKGHSTTCMEETWVPRSIVVVQVWGFDYIYKWNGQNCPLNW